MTWTPPYQINYASDGDTVYGAVVKCDNNISDAYSKLTILDTYRTEDHADISQLELAFDSLDSYVDDIASDVATLQQDLGTLEGSVSTLSSTVSGHTSSIGTLQSDLGTLSSTVSGHTSTLSSHTSTLSSHTSSIGSLTSGKVDIASANTISANHDFTGNPIFSGKLYFTGSGWNITENDSNHHLEFYYNTSLSHFWDDADGKYWGTSADFDGIVYADGLDTDNHGTGKVITRDLCVKNANRSYDWTVDGTYNDSAIKTGSTLIVGFDEQSFYTNVETYIKYASTAGKCHCYNFYGNYNAWDLSLDVSDLDTNTLIDSVVQGFKNHNISNLHPRLTSKHTRKKPPVDQPNNLSMTVAVESKDEAVNLKDLIQVLVLSVDDLRRDVSKLQDLASIASEDRLIQLTTPAPK
jgi:hypothetical protein